jgi:hypothetical protein
MEVALHGDELIRRLNTIATNAIREALIAKGRALMPWIDDDWRRQAMIAKILDLHMSEEIERGIEHYPLTSQAQAPRNPALDGLETKLADALNLYDANEEKRDEAPAPVSLPSKPMAVPKKAVG